jgi:iron complex outermembrane recepter protein
MSPLLLQPGLTILAAALAVAVASTAFAAEGETPAPAATQDAPPPPKASAPAAGLGEEITVVAPSRLPRSRDHGDGLSVTTVEGSEIRRAGARTVYDALQPLPGIHLADEQGTPFQQDLSMRGLTASPVTGVSQGLSVFLDGVRVNEPGAEEVNFDLLPLGDVEHVEVVRGPHAIFGRNTLGGAIQLVTRRGGATPRADVEVEGGSFAYQRAQARAAGPLGPLDAHLSISEGTEQGWRDAQASRGVRVFGKLGLLRGETDVGLSYQFQRDRLEQPGSLPVAMLEADRTQNYTAGDFFEPELHLVTLNARRELGEALSLSVNAHFRALDASQFNASWSSADTRMANRTRTFGGAAQLEHRARLGRAESLLSGGLEATRSAVHLRVSEEANGTFQTHVYDEGLPTEFAVPLPVVVGDLADDQVALGAFLQDHLQLAEGPLAGLGATAALRLDRISHDVADTTPVTTGAASGTGVYTRWVPAAGLSWTSRRWSASTSWSDGFRAPAFLELTCADPAAPCVGLQAGVAPDATFTHLRPVRSRSFDAGVKVTPVPSFGASLNVFRVDLHDDIYGVTAANTNEVWFQNVGDTRRQGLELSADARRGPVELEASWTYTRATFESDFQMATPRTGGEEDVRRGDRIPLVPDHVVDGEARVRALRWLVLSAGFRHVGSQRLRGDESNVAAPLPAYDLVRAGAEARFGRWTTAVRATNLLNARYETFGTYSVDARNGGVDSRPVPFLTPGAPVRLVVTMRWEVP